jgi:hypothetical protein
MAWEMLRAAGIAAKGTAQQKVVHHFCGRMMRALREDFDNEFAYFTASFSRHRNDINQWRVYADNGRGFALGLNPAFFHPREPKDVRPNERYWVGPVVYDLDEAKRRMREPIDRAVAIASMPASRGLPPLTEAVLVKRLGVALSTPILWNSLTTKDRAYEAEREVRLLAVDQIDAFAQCVKTRVRGSRLVPYIEFEFELHHVREVIIGPAAGSLAFDALAHLLRASDIDTSVIDPSRIPYQVH